MLDKFLFLRDITHHNTIATGLDPKLRDFKPKQPQPHSDERSRN